MKEVLKNILDWLELKVSYADLRFVQTEKENIEVENGILSSYNVSTDRGVGIRVLADGAWGFAASNNLDKVSLQETAAKALDIARASALTKKEEIRLAHEDKHIDTYVTPITKNPFQVSPVKKIDLLVKITRMMLKDKVKKSEGYLNPVVELQLTLSVKEISKNVLILPVLEEIMLPGVMNLLRR